MTDYPFVTSETENHRQAQPPAKAQPRPPARPGTTEFDISSPPTLRALRRRFAVREAMNAEYEFAELFEKLIEKQIAEAERLGEYHERLSPRTPLGVECGLEGMEDYRDGVRYRRSWIARLSTPGW